MRLYSDYKDTNSEVQGLQLIRLPPHWQPPEVGLLKVNVDAALFKNMKYGLVVIIRNEEGQVNVSASKFVPSKNLEPETAEI